MNERFYVCDKCGGAWAVVKSAGATKCAYCGHAALWQFSSAQAALQHSRDIKGRALA